MISVNPDKIVADFPAFLYLEARPSHDYDDKEKGVAIVHVHDEDVFACTIQGMQRQFTFGSVTGFAIRRCSCPFKAVEKAKARGHKLFWVNANSVCITSHKQEKKTFAVIELGTRVKFEGQYFELAPAANGNIHLKEI